MSRRTRAATIGLLVPAALALGMSADTSYRFLGATLQITNEWERALLCGVAEAAIIALTLYAWATATKAAAYLAYAAVLVQAIPAFQVSGGAGGATRVILGPVLLAALLHLLLGLELRMSGDRPDSLLRATLRELRERLTAWLGIGRRGTDSAAIARSRAADRAVALADLVAAVKPGSRRYRSRAARLAAAIDAARHGLDPVDATTAETVIVGRIVRRKSVGDLASIQQRHAWTASQTTAEVSTVVTFERAAEVNTDTPAEVDSQPTTGPVRAITAAPVDRHVICGAGEVYAPTVHPAATSSEVDTDTDGEVYADGDLERLPADTAADVIRACWVLGDTVTDAARKATRSRSYVGKVYARLNESRAAELPPVERLALVQPEVTAS